jgi:hypothetical protein
MNIEGKEPMSQADIAYHNLKTRASADHTAVIASMVERFAVWVQSRNDPFLMIKMICDIDDESRVDPFIGDPVAKLAEIVAAQPAELIDMLSLVQK